MKIIVVLSALLALTGTAQADPPGSFVFSVVVTTASNPIPGYLNVYNSKVDVSKPDILGQMKAAVPGYDQVWFWSNFVEIVEPYGMFASWGWPGGPIPLSSIKNITRGKGKYDGRQYSSVVVHVTAQQAALLQKPAVFKCATEYVEGGDYWLSYDPKVGEDQIQPFCTSKHSDEEEKAILKNAAVIHLQFSED